MRLFRRVNPTSPIPPAPVAQASRELRYSLFPSLNLSGHFDGITGDEIRGWIYDQSEPNRYIKLCLLLEGRFIEKTSSCIFRKDLEQQFQSRGLHGFAFRIPEHLRCKSELSVEIRLEDGRVIFGPSTLRNPNPRGALTADNERKPCLLVMHIPKTAVTAVRSALRSDALTDRQLWLYGEPPGLPVEHMLSLTESQLRRMECVVGHFHFGLHGFLPGPAVYTTVLREPVERCVSLYFHQRVKSADPEDPARCLTLDEFVRHPAEAQYDNQMVRMTVGAGAASAPIGAITRHDLKNAIENIHQSFCYLGLQQRTAESVQSLASYLNIQPNPLQFENLGVYDKQFSISASAARRLRELNRFDVELYEYVQKKFWTSGTEGWVNSVQGTQNRRESTGGAT